jgi:hypothetical protein
LIRLGKWTISAGLRWDHYQLLLNRQAVDPRLSIARYFPSADLVVHFSYDRMFQTPSFENILLSSSTAATTLDPIFFAIARPAFGRKLLRSRPGQGLFKKFRLDANYFRRLVNNYADDDQIDNTTISFPIAFQKATIYGAEAKIDLPDWNRFSGFVSYSYEVGNAWFPVTGGLFLGNDAVIPTSGHFPDSQDQRNTFAAGFATRSHAASGSRAAFNTTPVCRSISMAATIRRSPNTASRSWTALILTAAASILRSK